MSKKTLWLVVSSLMALSLIMAACGPAASTITPTTTSTPAPTQTTTLPPTQQPPQQQPNPPTGEVPRYGGTLNLPLSADITRFNTYGHTVGGPTIDAVNQGLWAILLRPGATPIYNTSILRG
jgi:hypothetical protein